MYDADGTPLKYHTWDADPPTKISSSKRTRWRQVRTPIRVGQGPLQPFDEHGYRRYRHRRHGSQPHVATRSRKILIDASCFAPIYPNSPVHPGPITPHLDVGDPGDKVTPGSYIFAINAMANDPTSPYYREGNPPDYTQFFIPAGDAKGGELIPETQCGLGPLPCQFQDYPGTMGYTRGLPIYASQHFDWSRLGYFHYLFSVHALAKPNLRPMCEQDIRIRRRWQITTKTARALPLPGGIQLRQNCSGPLDDNKAFHVPKTTGGKSNQPGTNAVIALGGWQKVTSGGVVLEQAADELYGAVGLHEIGHNGDLWHGGPPATWNPAPTRLLSFEPNCKPVLCQRDELHVPGDGPEQRQRQSNLL